MAARARARPEDTAGTANGNTPAPASKAAAAAEAKASEGGIQLRRIGRCMMRVPIVGTAPLIVNKFSNKAQEIMLASQRGEVTQRQPKDPEALFQASLHVMGQAEDGTPRYGFPAPGAKAAIIGAVRFYKSQKLTMEGMKPAVLVMGEGKDMLVPILTHVPGEGEPLSYAQPEMRRDTVRNATGVADIRFRGQFWPWAAVIEVVYVKTMMTTDSMVALVDAAGLGGLGEWRPASKESKTGMFGTFIVPEDAKVTLTDL